MYAVIGILSLVSSVPALWLGAKLVATFELPFITFGIPALVCIAIAGWAIARAEQEMAQ